MIDAAPSTARGTPGRSVAPFVAMVVTLCIVTGVALWIQPVRATPKKAVPPIALIGDSITDQARGELTEGLAPNAVDIRATPGRKLVEQLDVAHEVARENPERVVINLGSNDVLLDERPEVSIQALHDMVDLFPAKTCLHLVTVNEHFFALFPDGLVLQRRAQRLNNEIRRLASERHGAVIDWAKLVQDAGSASPPVTLTADTVHPNAAGKRKLADAYFDSIARGCPAPAR